VVKGTRDEIIVAVPRQLPLLDLLRPVHDPQRLGYEACGSWGHAATGRISASRRRAMARKLACCGVRS